MVKELFLYFRHLAELELRILSHQSFWKLKPHNSVGHHVWHLSFYLATPLLQHPECWDLGLLLRWLADRGGHHKCERWFWHDTPRYSTRLQNPEISWSLHVSIWWSHADGTFFMWLKQNGSWRFSAKLGNISQVIHLQYIYILYIYISLYIQYYMYKCICIRNCIYIYMYMYMNMHMHFDRLGYLGASEPWPRRGPWVSQRRWPIAESGCAPMQQDGWISWEDDGNFMGISWEFHGNMIGIWLKYGEYDGNITSGGLGIWWEYHGIKQQKYFCEI